MQRRLRIALSALTTLAALAAVLALTPGIEAQTAYPLSCRGGREMVVRFQAESDNGWTRLHIFFKRGSEGASQRLPAAGECAWLDRGISADEPDQLNIYFRGVRTWLDIQGDEQLRGYDFSGTEIEKSGRLRTLLDAIFGGEPFTVQARVAGSGDNRYFDVVRVGP